MTALSFCRHIYWLNFILPIFLKLFLNIQRETQLAAFYAGEDARGGQTASGQYLYKTYVVCDKNLNISNNANKSSLYIERNVSVAIKRNC